MGLPDAERLKNYNLQAEAEQIIARSNQEEIINLIRSYAPDYEATGKTLGEKLYDGFKAGVKNILSWFDDFSNLWAAQQQEFAQLALESANIFYASQHRVPVSTPPTTQARTVTVYQENTFTMPVESPAETARRIRQTGESLAKQLLMEM